MAYDDENDNDDVLGFGSEQDASQEDGSLSTDDLINMAQVTPEEEEKTKKDIFSRMEESAGQNPEEKPDDEYEEEPDDAAAELNQEMLEVINAANDDEPPEDQPGVERQKTQDELINEAVPEVKKAPEKSNKAQFLNRNKIMMIIGGIAVAFILFFAVVLPSLSSGKKKEVEKISLDKADAIYVPSEIYDIGADVPEYDSNSAMAQKFPPPGTDEASEAIAEQEKETGQTPPEPAYKQPVQVPNQNYGGGSSSETVTTNRNEQQKAFNDVTLTPHDNPLTSGTGNASYQQQADAFGRSADVYTPTTLNDSIDSYMQYISALTGETKTNPQQSKQDFWKSSGGGTGSGNYQWNSDFSLWKGTVIPAILESGINTDLPGVVIAVVTENIYSSRDQKYLLIPQGSKLFATYDSSISYDQNRVQVAWNTLIRPDGLEINLGGVEGIDKTGMSGYQGNVSNHPFAYAKALGLIAVFSLLDTKIRNMTANSNNMYMQNAMSDTYAEAQSLNNKILEKALDIQPTIKIPQGEKVNLITNLTMDIPPYEYEPAPLQKYIRKY